MNFLAQLFALFFPPAPAPTPATSASASTATIGTIEDCPITLHADTSVTWTAKAAIDGDGSGSAHGDPDFQGDTTLHRNGRALDSDVDKYIVVPPLIIRAVPGLVLGCRARVRNTLNGQETDAVTGDIGPRAKLGEVSIACAKALGIDPSPTTGGEERHVIEYTIYPGKAAEGYELQRA